MSAPDWLVAILIGVAVSVPLNLVYYFVTRLAVRHEQRATAKRILSSIAEEDEASRAHTARTSHTVDAPTTKRARPRDEGES